MPALPPDRPGCPNAPGGRRPLPDPAAIRLCLVPDPAPPYDGELPAGEPGGRGLPSWAPGDGRPWAVEPGQQAEPPPVEPGGGKGFREPWRGSRELASSEGRDGAPHGQAPPDGEPRGHGQAQGDRRPGRDRTRGAPGPGDWAGAPPAWQSRFAQVLAETLAGSRPPNQMVPWTTEEALTRIQRLGPRLASQQRPRVRRVLSSRPAADVLEMAVVVGFGPRVNALAVRLERSWPCPPARPGEPPAADPHAARWVCTAVEAA